MKTTNNKTRLADLKKAILTGFVMASAMGVFITHSVVLPLLNSFKGAEQSSIMPLEILYVMPVLIAGTITRLIYNINKRNFIAEE
jgi:hypothetical protein